MNSEKLQSSLVELDGQGYGSFKMLKGAHDLQSLELKVDRVQSDPFATPSNMRAILSINKLGYPESWLSNHIRRIALRDYLTRSFAQHMQPFSRTRGSGKSGMFMIDMPGQEILDRTSIVIDHDVLEVRFRLGLPAKGRRADGRLAAEMLCEELPKIVAGSLPIGVLDRTKVQSHIDTFEDAVWLREQLVEHNLVAFVANGSALPRKSGVDDRPLTSDSVVKWASPESLEVSFERPNLGLISGTGITPGVTLVVGGGYHGKSTLLQALQRGVYDHIPGDGREFVISLPSCTKIRAEDGRSVANVDIDPFISNLPQGQSTTDFSTSNASGSTSQAAGIMEVLECKAEVLLLDEDTCATNFMVRDRRMQALIAKNHEPITPFCDRVRQLFDQQNVSTILVMGGSGDYFDHADCVIAMHQYAPEDVTDRALEIAEQMQTGRQAESSERFELGAPRHPEPNSFSMRRGHKEVSVRAHGTTSLQLGYSEIDLHALEQLVDPSQLRAIAKSLQYFKTRGISGSVHELACELSSLDLRELSDFPDGDLAAFRPHEWAAVFNRIRSIKLKKT